MCTHAEIDALRARIWAKHAEVVPLIGSRYTDQDRLHLTFADAHLTYAVDLLAQGKDARAAENFAAARKLTLPLIND